MKQLNFLPESVRAKEADRQLITLLVGVGIFSLLAIAVLWVAVRAEVSSVNRQVATVRAQEADVTKTVQVADTDTQSRIVALNALARVDTDWATVFQLTDSLVAKDITLSGFGLTSSANGILLTMTGTSPSSVSFASYVEAFQGSKLLVGTKVPGYNYSPSKGTVTFTVSGILFPAFTRYKK